MARESCSKNHRLLRCSCGPAAGALPNEWPQKPGPLSSLDPWLLWLAVPLRTATRWDSSWLRKRGAGLGLAWGRRQSSEGGGEVTGWSRVSPYALHM
jgi:hypothetical protein